MRKYLLDSNFFIQAHRFYYPLDIFPSFWNKTKELAERGLIFSLDKVQKEVYDNASHEDELKAWCIDNLPQDFFLVSDSAIGRYISIVNWANAQRHHYNTRAIQKFLETDLADPWLVAYAMEHKLTVVTYEKSQPEKKNNIKIPEVCRAFGVDYVDSISMMRELGERF